MKNMMNTVATSISKTNNGIGTGIYIPDEMVKGIDPNQLTALLTHVLSSVYSAIYADEKKQMDEMLARGICPMCGASLDEDDCDCDGDCDCCDGCDCEDDEDELMLDEDEDEEEDENDWPMMSFEDVINYLNSIC